MCKKLVVSVALLVIFYAGSALALVVNDTQTWGATRIENLAGGGLEVGPQGNLTITGRIDMDRGAWIRMSGGILNTTNTLKFPDSKGSQNVRMYIDAGTFTAHDIEHRGWERDGIIYVGGGNLIVQTGIVSGNRQRDPQQWLQDNTLRPAEGYDQIFLTDLGGGVVQITTSPPSARVGFDSEASGDLETVSPAVLTVAVEYAEQGQAYTVDYAATGGTAMPGVDYTLTPGTLTFNPGETSKTISIDIVDDGIDEEDETIIVELSNATGVDVILVLRPQNKVC